MHSLNTAATTARPNNTRLGTTPRKPGFLRILDTIAGWDARYREAQKLKRMPQYRLEDMGIPARGASRRGR